MSITVDDAIAGIDTGLEIAAAFQKPGKSTQEFFSHITHKGVSRPNRFSVIIPMPTKMQPKIDEAKHTESNTSKIFGEAIKVLKVFTGSNSHEMVDSLQMSCSQTELPGKTINTSETRYNGDVFKIGQSIMYGNQQFAFEVTRDMFEKNIIDQWMDLIVNPDTHEISYFKDYVVNIEINQLDVSDNIVHTVILEDAFPVNSNALTLSAHETNTIHELQVQFAYRRWKNKEIAPNNGLLSSLMQTPLGPYLAPLISNPAVQRAFDYVTNATGIDLQGEAMGIYNQIDKIVKSTTGESINSTVGLLNSMTASIEVNDKITPLQQVGLLDLIEGTLNHLK